MQKEKKPTEVDEIMQHINNAVKGCKIMLGDDERLRIRRLETGIPPLDEILGGGLPFGRVTIFAGEEQGGKSFLACKAIVAAQQQNLKVAIIDVERSFDPLWASKIGVDLSKLMVCETSSGEEALDIAVALTSIKVDVIVLDSIAGLLPIAERDGSMDDQFIGLQARLVNKGLRKLIQENSGDTIIILINQLRAKIGGWVVDENLPGGKGQGFFSGIILMVKRGAYIKDGEEKIGFIMRLFTKKNKTYTPMLKTEIPFLFTGELDLVRSVVLRAIELGIIRRSGAYYEYEDFPNGKILGKQGALDYMGNHSDIYDKLVAEVKKYN